MSRATVFPTVVSNWGCSGARLAGDAQYTRVVEGDGRKVSTIR